MEDINTVETSFDYQLNRKDIWDTVLEEKHWKNQDWFLVQLFCSLTS